VILAILLQKKRSKELLFLVVICVIETQRLVICLKKGQQIMSTIREQLIELFYDNNVHCDQTIEHLVDDVVDIIKSSSDVVEVRHGKWIEHHRQSYLVHPMQYDEYGSPVLQDCVYYECSECGRTESKKEPYCHCGAMMDGK
jgi:hypothetical protein